MSIASRIRHFFRRRREGRAADAHQLDSEMQFHIEQQSADYIAQGHSPDEARRRAAAQFGSQAAVIEGSRDARWETRIEQFVQDLRFGFRVLGKTKRSTILSICALALGIGSSTIIFTIMYNGVLHPFAYRSADRLTTLHLLDSAAPNGEKRSVFYLDEIVAFRERNHSFEDIVGYANWFVLYSHDGVWESLHGAAITPNTLDVLGMQPIIGRGFAPDDYKHSTPPVVLLNWRLWHSLYHEDPSVIGKQITLDDVPRTIVGVMPKRFQHLGADIYLPTAWDQARPANLTQADMRQPQYFWATGIIKKGVTAKQASEDLTLIAQSLKAAHPDDFPKDIRMGTQLLTDAVVGNLKDTLVLLIVAVVLLLLIACSNVAGLLLAQASARSREIALRATLGASRARLVRQLLTESLALALAGCIAGCALAAIGVKYVVAALPPGRIPWEADVSLNRYALVFAVSVSLLTTLFFGLSPALHAIRGDLARRLASSGGTGNAANSGSGARFRSALVACQIALSILLLVTAGLSLRSFFALTRVDLGIDPHNVLLADLQFPAQQYGTTEQKRQFFSELLTRVSAIPGVTHAATLIESPLQGAPFTAITIPGSVHGEEWNANADIVSADYFDSLGLHLLKGRLLTPVDEDSARFVAVVSRAFADRYFPGADPLGHTVKLNAFDTLPDSPRNAYFEIVGVVSDLRTNGPKQASPPQVYLPYTVTPFGDRSLIVRTSIPPANVVNSLRLAVAAIDHNVALVSPRALEDNLNENVYAAPRFSVLSFGLCASVGLLLAIVGIFSVMAYTVSLLTHEVGIRMALGAPRAAILRMVLGYGARIIGAGVVLGLAGSFVVARAMRTEVWGVSAFDPLTFVAVAASVIAIGVSACYIPARRATEVDPNIALRHE
jgi:putative ABC transport system permease protein